MIRPAAVTAMLSLLLGACACAVPSGTGAPSDPSPTSKPVASSLVVDTGTLFQDIEGFGASGCWWAQDVGGWEADRVDRVVDLLFDKEKGIGLSIYRFEVGGGDVNESSDFWRRAETFETAPGTYDWSRDAASVGILRKAVGKGVDTVVFIANTPPGRLTRNGRTTGGDGGGPNLAEGKEGEYARYLVDIALHFRDEGIPVRYISPLNEPQWEWKAENGQEGCHYDPPQILAMARALAEELVARGADIRPSLIDSGKWLDKEYTVGLYKTLGGDPVVGPLMDHYAVHSYWSSEQDKRTAVGLLEKTGVDIPLWQTEWCQMEHGRDLGMNAALVLARCVHEDLTIADVTAWSAWLAVSRYDYKDGLVYVDGGTREVMDSKRLWALGNYSRFLGDGYRRVSVEDPDGNLLPSAFLSPDGNRLVMVVVNPVPAALPYAVDVAGFPRFSAYETSESHSLDQVGADLSGTYEFPPYSVTTLVLER